MFRLESTAHNTYGFILSDLSLHTSRKKVTRGAPVLVTRGAGPCATDCHATGKKIAVAQVSLCAMGIYIAVAHQN